MLKAGLNDPGQADRRVPVRRPDRHRQDRARQDARRVPVRLDRPHDPARHERVPDARVDPARSSASGERRATTRLADRRACASSRSRWCCSTSSRRRIRNVWDLFLQVFDDGRLTDATGQVADFRHCIIILTSNLGATAHRDSGLGFAPGAEAFSSDQILRAVGQTFRPEFLNRLDKVIVFRPLDARR